MINIYVVPILVLIGFIQVWESFKVPKFINISALIFLSAFLFITLKHSKHIIHNRYYGFLKEGINPHLQTITPYLRSIGINRDDIIISVPDNSPNMSLYLMNSSNIPYFINQGAKYLIVNESIFVHSDWYEPYMKNLIAEYHGIKIYEIKK
jgi:hypothetical protein